MFMITASNGVSVLMSISSNFWAATWFADFAYALKTF
jgi:hypothetical protein